MILLRPFSAILAAGCLFLSPALRADAPSFTPAKQFSADQLITTKDGTTVTAKIYSDNGKLRTQASNQGMDVVSIIRPDQQKMYSLIPSQKMVMIMPINQKMTQQLSAAQGYDGKFETVGPDTVDGTACTKYKMTTTDGKVFFWWVSTASKNPVKLAADDGSFTVAFKNYVVGPQEASLFEPPADYQVMQMPTGPGGMGNGGPGQ